MSTAMRTGADTVVAAVPTRRQEVHAAIRNGLLRPGADDSYADGDDATWMRIAWPSLVRRVPVLGREMNVLDTGGDKPVLLFVHGLGGVWQNWLLNIPAFTDSHRVIAPDLPGFGESEMPAEKEISIKGYAKALDALCDELGVECPVVVGNSMGGFIGAELALSFPTRVQRLVLVSAAGLSIEYRRRQPLLFFARLWGTAATWIAARAESVVTRPRMRRLGMQLLVRYPEKLSPQLTYELARGTGVPGFMPALEALLDYSYRDLLERIEVPVLIVWGENDMLVPAEDAEEYERLIGANARREVFPDTGHLPMVERPSRFNELLAGFIAEEREPEALSA
jgi:pimeloyl-ACP methyl ester carboxylesterase